MLAKTISENNLDMLTITAPGSASHRRGIVVSGRVHPGESNSSWVMRGFIRLVLGPSPEAAALREKYGKCLTV